MEFNRVNGNLALSRALGDFVFKMNEKLPQSEQIVTCLPDIQHEIIQPDWDFIILACDGIWDVLSSQEVTDFITERISRGMEPEDICEELMNRSNFQSESVCVSLIGDCDVWRPLPYCLPFLSLI